MFAFRKSVDPEDFSCFDLSSVRTSTNPMRRLRLPLDGLLYVIGELKKIVKKIYIWLKSVITSAYWIYRHMYIIIISLWITYFRMRKFSNWIWSKNNQKVKINSWKELCCVIVNIWLTWFSFPNWSKEIPLARSTHSASSTVVVFKGLRIFL
jgi:hypothetical protein